MIAVGFFSLAVLTVALAFQLLTYRTGRFQGAHGVFFWGSVGLVFLYYLYLVYVQYVSWKGSGGIVKFLVPPYESVFYVFGYHFTRFLLYYLISFLVALLFLMAARHYNKKFSEKFFESEEPYWGALSVFLLGSPVWNYAWAFYVVALLVLAVVLSLFKGHFKKQDERLSLRFMWLPVAILVILIKILI